MSKRSEPRIRFATARSRSTRRSPIASARFASSSRTSETARTSSCSPPGATASPRSCSRVRQDLRRQGVLSRPGRPDDDADEGEARREARADDPRGHRLPALPRARAALASFAACGSRRRSRSTRRTVALVRLRAGRAPEDVDATLERLLSCPASWLPSASASSRSCSTSSRKSSRSTRPSELMRAVFQAQPEVAHVYLGSRRHMMGAIFNDENEPFWRSAKQVQLGPIRPELFAPFIAERFRSTGGASAGRPSSRPRADRRPSVRDAGARYFTWEATPGADGHPRTWRRARGRAALGARALLTHLGGASAGSGSCSRRCRRAGHPYSRTTAAAPPAAGDERAEGPRCVRRSSSASARTARTHRRAVPRRWIERTPELGSLIQSSSAISAAALAAPSDSTGR